MIEIGDAAAFLADTLQQHPLAEIINTVLWLDPLWNDADEDEWEDDSLGRALMICRQNFVEIYANALIMMRQRADDNENEVALYIQQAVQKFGIPLEDIEEMAYGIPVEKEAVGINLRDPETYTRHAFILPVVRAFGINPHLQAESDKGYDYFEDTFDDDEENGTAVVIPDRSYTTAKIITDSLGQIERDVDEDWFRVNRLIEWIFGQSGNTLIDLSPEEIGDGAVETLQWDEDDIALAVEMVAEVSPFMIDARIGAERLDTCPDMMKTLKNNIHRVKRALKNHDSKITDTFCFKLAGRLDWGLACVSPDRETLADPELLLVRGDADPA